MKLAIGQFAPTLGDLQGNLERTREFVEQATEAGAELVVFPELSLSGYLIGDLHELPALPANDQRLRTATATAGRAAVVVGFPETDGRHVFNSAALLADGELHHVHRKLILPTYGPFSEREHFAPGDALRAFDTPLGRAAVLLCEDVVQPAFGKAQSRTCVGAAAPRGNALRVVLQIERPCRASISSCATQVNRHVGAARRRRRYRVDP